MVVPSIVTHIQNLESIASNLNGSDGGGSASMMNPNMMKSTMQDAQHYGQTIIAQLSKDGFSVACNTLAHDPVNGSMILDGPSHARVSLVLHNGSPTLDISLQLPELPLSTREDMYTRCLAQGWSPISCSDDFQQFHLTIEDTVNGRTGLMTMTLDHGSIHLHGADINNGAPAGGQQHGQHIATPAGSEQHGQQSAGHDHESHSDDGLPTWAWATIIGGSVLAVGAVGGGVWYCQSQQKREAYYRY